MVTSHRSSIIDYSQMSRDGEEPTRVSSPFTPSPSRPVLEFTGENASQRGGTEASSEFGGRQPSPEPGLPGFQAVQKEDPTSLPRAGRGPAQGPEMQGDSLQGDSRDEQQGQLARTWSDERIESLCRRVEAGRTGDRGAPRPRGRKNDEPLSTPAGRQTDPRGQPQSLPASSRYLEPRSETRDDSGGRRTSFPGRERERQAGSWIPSTTGVPVPEPEPERQKTPPPLYRGDVVRTVEPRGETTGICTRKSDERQSPTPDLAAGEHDGSGILEVESETESEVSPESASTGIPGISPEVPSTSQEEDRETFSTSDDSAKSWEPPKTVSRKTAPFHPTTPGSATGYSLRTRSDLSVVEGAIKAVARRQDPASYSTVPGQGVQSAFRGLRSGGSGERARILDYQATSQTGLQTANVQGLPRTEGWLGPNRGMSYVQVGTPSLQGSTTGGESGSDQNAWQRSDDSLQSGGTRSTPAPVRKENDVSVSDLSGRVTVSPIQRSGQSVPAARDSDQRTNNQDSATRDVEGSVALPRSDNSREDQSPSPRRVDYRHLPTQPNSRSERPDSNDRTFAQGASSDQPVGTRELPVPGPKSSLGKRSEIPPTPGPEWRNENYPAILIEPDSGPDFMEWDPHVGNGVSLPSPRKGVMPQDPEEVRELFVAIGELRSGMDEKDAAREEAEKRYQDGMLEIERLTASLDLAREQIEAERVEVARKEADSEMLRHHLEVQQAHLREMQTEMRNTGAKNAECSELQRQQMTQLADALEEALRQRTEAQRQQIEQQLEKNQVESRANVVQVQAEQLSEALVASRAQAEELQAQITQAAQAEERCWAQYESLRRELDAQRMGREAERRQLDESVSRMNAEREAHRREMCQLRAERERQQELMTQIGRELDAQRLIKMEFQERDSSRNSSSIGATTVPVGLQNGFHVYQPQSSKAPPSESDKPEIPGNSRPGSHGTLNVLTGGASSGSRKKGSSGSSRGSRKGSRRPPPSQDSSDSGSESDSTDSSDDEEPREAQAAASSAYRPRDFKLPTFSGKMAEDAMAWWRKVENEFSMHSMTWTVQRGVIYRNLAGAAQVWFDSLADSGTQKKGALSSLKKFKAAFLAKFTAQDTKLMAEYSWNRRKQRVGESVDDYVNDMVIVGHQIGVTEQEKFKTILRGLLPGIQAEVMKMRPSTLDELITNARIASASADLTQGSVTAAVMAMGEVTEAVKGIPGAIQAAMRDNPAVVQAVATPGPQMVAETNRRPYNGQNPPRNQYGNGGNRSNPRPAPNPGSGSRGGQCYGCGSPDHWRSECPQRGNNYNSNRGNSGPPQCYGCGVRGHVRRNCPNIPQGQAYGVTYSNSAGPGNPGWRSQNQDWPQQQQQQQSSSQADQTFGGMNQQSGQSMRPSYSNGQSRQEN